jgi:bifunctional non-homologous end joining protein LigD
VAKKASPVEFSENGVAALYLGKWKATWERWERAGPGPSPARKQLDTVVSPKSKLTKQVKKPMAVDPIFVADVEFRDITAEGLLRQSLSRK